MQLLHGDCLEIMKSIPDQSIDLVLTDPPYGTTACKWDSVIPFEPMWTELKRIRKGAVVLFGAEPFNSFLRCSNIKEFRYDWVWKKDNVSGFMHAKRMPLKEHETLSVFYAGKVRYFPQGLILKNKERKNTGARAPGKNGQNNYGEGQFKSGPKNNTWVQEFTNYPRSIIFNAIPRKTMHPTQKPIALLEYLIKTYTLEGDTVLDFTMGSGSTGVACKNLNRNFIGIEKDDKYFQIACSRLDQIN